MRRTKSEIEINFIVLLEFIINRFEMIEKIKELNNIFHKNLEKIENSFENNKYVKYLEEHIEKFFKGELYDRIFKLKKDQYDKNGLNLPQKENVTHLISKASNFNALTTFGVSIVPGPWSLAASFSEVLYVLEHQIGLVYDVGVACGYKDKMNSDILIQVYKHSIDFHNNKLKALKGSKTAISITSVIIKEDFYNVLSKAISKNVLRSMSAEVFPVIGAVVFTTWTRMSTLEIGKNAYEIFEYHINSKTNQDYREIELMEVDKTAQEDYNYQKIICLIILVNLDNNEDKEQRKLIDKIINKITLTTEHKTELHSILNENKIPKFEIENFKHNSLEVKHLLIDMKLLVNYYKENHPFQHDFILKCAKDLGYTEEEFNNLTCDIPIGWHDF
jgi:hypothetical protein